MGYAILAAIATVCALNWLNRYVCNRALLLFMQKKGYEMPSGDEMTACLTEAWLHTFHLE